MRESKRDVYQDITEQIITAIESGAGDFHMPWHSDGLPRSRPVNALTGNAYRGVNVLALWTTAEVYGYTSNAWATFRQWQQLGARVTKGEHGTLIVFYKRMERESKDGEADEKSAKPYLLARASLVFNVDQVEGWEPPPRKVRGIVEGCEAAEAFVAAAGPVVRHGGGDAYYRPSSDHIQMPDRDRFTGTATSTTTETYYATLLHELTHWTGHSSRLDRDFSARFGIEAYAMEELVAELGAAFLCADVGIENNPRQDHAAYIARWLKVLRDDKKALFTAASQASRAAEFLASLQPAVPEAAI